MPCQGKKESLVQRTIIEDPLCDCYRVASENPLHTIWSCTELDMVWSNLELWSFRSAVQFLDYKELSLWIILQGKKSGTLCSHGLVDLDPTQPSSTSSSRCCSSPGSSPIQRLFGRIPCESSCFRYPGPPNCRNICRW